MTLTEYKKLDPATIRREAKREREQEERIHEVRAAMIRDVHRVMRRRISPESKERLVKRISCEASAVMDRIMRPKLSDKAIERWKARRTCPLPASKGSGRAGMPSKARRR